MTTVKKIIKKETYAAPGLMLFSANRQLQAPEFWSLRKAKTVSENSYDQQKN